MGVTTASYGNEPFRVENFYTHLLMFTFIYMQLTYANMIDNYVNKRHMSTHHHFKLIARHDRYIISNDT